MFGRDDSIADGSHIDAPIQFSPQAIQKAAVCSETFLIGIQIMLRLYRNTEIKARHSVCKTGDMRHLQCPGFLHEGFERNEE